MHSSRSKAPIDGERKNPRDTSPRADKWVLPPKASTNEGLIYIFLSSIYVNDRGKYIFQGKKYINFSLKYINHFSIYVNRRGIYVEFFSALSLRNDKTPATPL